MFNRGLIFSRCFISRFKNYGSCAVAICKDHKSENTFIGLPPDVADFHLTKAKQITTDKLSSTVKHAGHIGLPYTRSISSEIIKSEVFNTLKLDICLPTISNAVEKIDECWPDNYIEAPHKETIFEKQAARLIVIRRRKMKKHKLRKLRKRMKFEWAKVRQRREFRKEKLFQSELVAQIKEAEKFDAARYVAERLQKATAVPSPRNRVRKL